jgi:DNA replication and repair protein RecF
VQSGFAVRRLALSHFRSHRALRLDLTPGLIALHGPNGAGKTNVLEALSLLSPGRGLRRAGPEELARRPEGLGWKIAADLTGPAGAQEAETWAEPGEARQVRLNGKAATQGSLARICRVLWLVPSMDRLWLDGAEGRRRWLDRAAMSFLPDHGEAVLAYDRAMRERNRLLKDQVQDAHWYLALEAQMVEAGDAVSAARREALARLAQVPADPVFPRADLAIAGADGADLPEGPAFAETLRQGRRRDMAAGRTLSGPHRADLTAVYAAKGTPAAQCSTGEQKALLISLILANARALAADLGGPPVLLLDEVAAHLDPGRRAALYGALAAMGAQAVMTGTEAALFDSLPPGAQRLAVAETGGLSQVTPG